MRWGKNGASVGKEKSCTKRNFLGLLGFGIMDKGEVWNGPPLAAAWKRAPNDGALNIRAVGRLFHH
jgi:hypothetical protein